MDYFGRRLQDGTVAVFNADGSVATRLPRPLGMPYLYPVGSNLSTHYEHPEGIVLDAWDARKLSLAIEA